MRISQIVATKSRPEPLRRTLESSLDDLPDDGEIIVIDGDPERSAATVVESVTSGRQSKAVTYLLSTPGSSTRQRNVGIDAARGEILVFTDDDVVVLPGMFEALAAAFDDPSVVGATGRIINPRETRVGSEVGRLRWLLLGGGRQGTMTSFGFRRPLIDVESPRDMQYMPGSLMVARRALASEVRFDEALSGYALGEDDDFSYRLARHGRIVYVPDAVMRHESLGTRSVDRRALDRLVVVNRTYLFRKNFATGIRARIGFFVLLALLFAHRAINREWQGIRGLIEGVREVRRTQGASRRVAAASTPAAGRER